MSRGATTAVGNQITSLLTRFALTAAAREMVSRIYQRRVSHFVACSGR